MSYELNPLSSTMHRLECLGIHHSVHISVPNQSISTLLRPDSERYPTALELADQIPNFGGGMHPAHIASFRDTELSASHEAAHGTLKRAAGNRQFHSSLRSTAS